MEKLILSLTTALMGLTGAESLQEEYYQKEIIPIPEGEVVEIGCLDLFGKDQLVLGTRRGDIWVLSDINNPDPKAVKWEKVFDGAHEPLGIYERDGWFYFTDRDAFARIGDTDGNGTYETYEVISDQWGITGDYHEYNFGSKPDANGDVWVAHCLTGSFNANAQWRGWVQKISADGTTTPIASGVRSPGGIGFNKAGDVFYTDNQGRWNGTSCLKHAKPLTFTGCPMGNKFYKDAPHMGPQPADPKNGSRIAAEAKRIPEFTPPAVQLPHGKVGQSPSAILTPEAYEQLGLPEDQLLIGEHTHSGVQRVFLEQVNGVYQGVVWKFLENMRTGILALDVDANGTMFAGGSTRGWPSMGVEKFSLERVKWKGIAPLEMEKVEALHDGFKITFSEPVDPAFVMGMSKTQVRAWTYIYQQGYGSPEVDAVNASITSAALTEDDTVLTIKLDKMTQGHVHHISLHDVETEDGKPLWHSDAYYTLNQIPAK